MDNMLSPTLQFGRSNFDSTLKRINNNLSGGGSHSLSFSDKGEFVFGELQADRWERKKNKNLLDKDVVPLHWYKNKE